VEHSHYSYQKFPTRHHPSKFYQVVIQYYECCRSENMQGSVIMQSLWCQETSSVGENSYMMQGAWAWPLIKAILMSQVQIERSARGTSTPLQFWFTGKVVYWVIIQYNSTALYCSMGIMEVRGLCPKNTLYYSKTTLIFTFRKLDNIG